MIFAFISDIVRVIMKIPVIKSKLAKILIGFVSAIALIALLIFFLTIRKADIAIEEARQALKGEELRYVRTDARLGERADADKDASMIISSAADFSEAVIFEEAVYVSSGGGLLRIVKGNPEGGQKVINPFARNMNDKFRPGNRSAGNIYPQGARRPSRITEDKEFKPDELITVSHGLGENQISGLTVDEDEGRLVIAHPRAGVSVINGNTVSHFSFREKRYNRIVAVSNGADGGILIITDRGDLIELRGDQFRLKQPTIFKNRKVIITSILAAPEALFIGTDRSGLYRVSSDTLTEEGEEIFKDIRINRLAASGEIVYIATDRGFYERKTRNSFEIILKNQPVSSIALSEGGGIFAGTYFGEVAGFSSGRKPRVDRIAQEPVTDILPIGGSPGGESAGSLFLITRSAIFRKSAEGKMLRIETSGMTGALGANYITSFEIDDAGRLWIGYFDRGIDIMDDSLSVKYHLENDDIRIIRHLKKNPKTGRIYAATSRGVIRIGNDFRYDIINKEHGLISNEVSHINFTPEGEVYSTAGGVTINRSGLMRSLYVFNGLGSNHTYSSVFSAGNLYVATLNGMSVVRDMKVISNHSTLNSHLPHNWVTALADDAGGNIWVGTYGGGVALLSKDVTWKEIDFPFKKIDVNNNAILHTGRFLLIGTLSNGIIIYDTAEDEWIKYNRNLPSGNITALSIYGNYILIGTDSGLAMFTDELLN